MVRIARQDATEVLEPGEEPLDLPAAGVAAQGSPILGRWLLPPATMGCNHGDLRCGQGRIERITLRGPVTNQSCWAIIDKTRGERVCNKGDFIWASRFNVDGDRKTSAVCNCHDLQTFAPPGCPHTAAPFFATTKVLSMKHSERSK
jgi:hypothetical protein